MINCIIIVKMPERNATLLHQLNNASHIHLIMKVYTHSDKTILHRKNQTANMKRTETD